MRYAWMVCVLHVCIRQGCPCYLLHGICFRLVEIIPTVSLAMGLKLASHCNSFIYQKKISTYLCTCLLCELPKNKCVLAHLSFFWSVWIFKNSIMSTHVCAYCLMCGLSFSFLPKLMALRLGYLLHHYVFCVTLMLCFYCISSCGFGNGPGKAAWDLE